MKTLFYGTKETIKTCFTGKFLMWQIFAVVLTAIIVLSGFDWYYFVTTRSQTLHKLIYPALIGGFLLPVFIPLAFLFIGKILKEKKATIVGFALGQAALYSVLLSYAYKSLTGRIPPMMNFRILELGSDISRGFQFGFMRGGIFWGWPSSHTTVAFAMAAAFYILFPKEKIWRVLAFVYALYVGLSVSVSIHWFSEFIAGAIFGSVVGIVVGKAFKKRLDAN